MNKSTTTMIVVVAGIGGLVTAAVMGVDKEVITVIGVALVGIAGAMKSMFGGEDA